MGNKTETVERKVVVPELNKHINVFMCGNCGKHICDNRAIARVGKSINSFCNRCGSRLDWSEVKP